MRGCSINSAPTASGATASPRRSGGRTCTRWCSCATSGSTRTSARVRTAIDLVRDNVTWGPGFGDSPFFEGEVEPCINGRVVALGAYFGERSDRLVDRLLSEQLGDGGWNCEAERGSVRSSFHTTICVLEGLLAFEQAFGATPAVTDARKRAQEYLLERRLLRRLSTGEIIEPTWTQFAFPPLWHYDVLRALDYLRAAGVPPDARVEEAVAIVRERRQDDGRWLLDVRHREYRFTRNWPAPSARRIVGSRCARSGCWIGMHVETKRAMSARRPSQAMQRTASSAGFHITSVCHTPVGCESHLNGLAVADLVSR